MGTGARWTEFLEAGVVAHGAGAETSWGVVSVVMAMMSGAARSSRASRTAVVTAAGGTVVMVMAVHAGWFYDLVFSRSCGLEVLVEDVPCDCK